MICHSVQANTLSLSHAHAHAHAHTHTHTHTHTVKSAGDSEELEGQTFSHNDCYFCLIFSSSSNPPITLFLVPLKSSASVFTLLFSSSFLSSSLRHSGSPCSFLSLFSVIVSVLSSSFVLSLIWRAQWLCNALHRAGTSNPMIPFSKAD